MQCHKRGHKDSVVDGAGELVLGGAGDYGLVEASLETQPGLQDGGWQEGPAGCPA